MKNKRPPIHDDFDDDDFSDDASELIAEDIPDICGEQNAQRGRVLFAAGGVTQCSFDGNALHATIREGTTLLPVVFDLRDDRNSCSDANHARKRDPACEHIAALLFAYVANPNLFLPQTAGDFLKLIEQNPAARDKIIQSDPQSAELLDLLDHAAETRAALDRLSLSNPVPTPQNIAALRTVDLEQKRAHLRSQMSDLTLEQLRAIAKRRDWKLNSNAKDAIVLELAARLETALPRDVSFSSEEEQLLALENLAFGFQRDLYQNQLNLLWQQRAGGDLKRLDAAVRGLQTTGLLFPCTRNGSMLHYHWSPFLQSDQLPVLTPKIKYYPHEKNNRLKTSEPTPPLLTLLDAAIEMIGRAPLRLRAQTRNPQFDQQPFIGSWDYDPQEVEQAIKQRRFAYGVYGVLTIPLVSALTDETLDTLAAFTNTSRDAVSWFVALLLGAQLAMPTNDGRIVIHHDIHTQWQVRSPDEQYRILWDGWGLGAGAFAELRFATQRANIVVKRFGTPQFTPAALSQEIGRARQYVARLLAPLDPLMWYSFKAFAEYARDLRADFLHSLTHDQDWFLAGKNGQRYQPFNPANWDTSYRPVLATFLETGLRWFGALETAYEGKDLVAFRITPLGAWLMSNGLTGAPPTFAPTVETTGAAITWLDDATFRLRATPDVAAILPLARAFTEPTGKLLTFRATNATIARAFEHGIAANEIAEKFAPLPEAFRARLAALDANFGRVHLYEQLTVVELGDDLALRELIAGTSIAKYIVHQFSPRLVVVRDENVDELVNELVKKGYTPRVTTNEKQDV